MNNSYNIRCNLIKHMRNLYYDGSISDHYKYNIHNNTITFLIEYLQENHSEIQAIEDLNFCALRDFLKYLREDPTQRQFLSIHRDVVNMEFNVNITDKELRENKNVKILND